MSSEATERKLPSRAVVALVAFLGYFGIARIVENFYPFSTFSMYADHRGESASRLIARDAHGSLREVRDYVAFACAPPPSVRCSEMAHYDSIDYVDRDTVAYIASHHREVTAGEPIQFVRYVWRFDSRSPTLRTEECVLSVCRAATR